MSSCSLTGRSAVRSCPRYPCGWCSLSHTNYTIISGTKVPELGLCLARRPLSVYFRSAIPPISPYSFQLSSWLSISPNLISSTVLRHHHKTDSLPDQRHVIRQTNRQCSLENMYLHLEQLLIIGGVEPNPGPHHNRNQHINNLRISHVNINSVTVPGRLEELGQFVDTHDIDILTLSETKLDENVHKSLFKLDNFMLHSHATGTGMEGE